MNKIIVLLLSIISFTISVNSQINRGIKDIMPSSQISEARTALVIGNAAYSVGPLRNPVNDARLVARALRESGFDVILYEDANKAQIKTAIGEFGRKIRHGGVGLFFFSGHGVQLKDRNYLIPVGAEIVYEQHVELEAIDVSYVSVEMENAENRLNVVILDACRNNPYVRSFRSAGRGLAQMDAPRGTLIAYSTKPGEIALDGDGMNSPFTEALVKMIRMKGMELMDVLKRVRKEVRIKTADRQIPWEASMVEGDFYFNTDTVGMSDRSYFPSEPTITEDAALKILGLQNQTSEIRPQIVNPAGIEWVFIKGGTFEMGDTFGDGEVDEKPVHSVTVSDLYLGKTEVTVTQYRAFCNATGRAMPSAPGWGWQEDNPIVNVSWNDAKAFCDWAGCRLPTEAEWEYAAREGGKQVRFGNGKDIANPSEFNFDGSANNKKTYFIAGIYRQKTTSIANFLPNALGLYDMSGNVWEWCSDWFGESFYNGSQSQNPQGPYQGTYRVLRGGSWLNDAGICRSTYRSWGSPDGWRNSRGFRAARTP